MKYLRKLWCAWHEARNRRRIPKIVECLEKRLGSIDVGRIKEVHIHSHRGGKHGKYRLFVYAHENDEVYHVREYEDGYREFIHCTEQRNLEIPEKALEYLEWKLAHTVELWRISEVYGDGYSEGEHGAYRLFIYRKENWLEKVFVYEDGHIEPAYTGYPFS